MAKLLQGISRLFSGEVRFIAGLYLLLVTLFAALRLVLLVRNTNLAEGVATGELLKSFLVGARFDLAVASYLLIRGCNLVCVNGHSGVHQPPTL